MDAHPDGLKFSLYFNFLKGNAKVPQMPETSLRLRELLASEHASLEQVTRLLHSNPPLAAYLLQFAESPLLRGSRPGINLQEVISRLGLKHLNNLVLTFTIHHMLSQTDPVLLKVFRTRWNASLLCASYCACLSQQLTRLPLEDAMLAGLVQDIGSLPVIDEVENWSGKVPTEVELMALCDELSANVGVIVLTSWNLPQPFIECARLRGQWEREHAAPADLIDVVQVARCLAAGADSDLVRLPAWQQLVGQRTGEFTPAQLRGTIDEPVRFWFKLLGGKGT